MEIQTNLKPERNPKLYSHSTKPFGEFDKNATKFLDTREVF